MNRNQDMGKKTSSLALGSVFTAFSVVLLYIAGVLPTMRIALSAAAGLFCAVMLMSRGAGYSLLVYIATSLISLFFLPVKTPPFIYFAFFGYYPILKYFIEKLRSLPIEWLLKLLSFNLVFTLLLYFSSYIAGLQDIFTAFPVYILYIAANIAMILYDFAFSLLIARYRSRLTRL